MLLSIIVPTKNRKVQLDVLLMLWEKYFLNKEEIELVIFDTSDISLSYVGSSNVKYIFDNSINNVQDSFEIAINISTGDYLCFIGDDDFVNSNILKHLKGLILKESFDILHYPRAHYYWSDVKFDHKSSFFNSSTLIKKKIYTKSTKHIFLLEELNSFENNGFRNLCGLPSIYHGIVRRGIIDFSTEIFVVSMLI